MLWKGDDGAGGKSLYSPRIGDPLAVNSGYFGDGYLAGLESEASIVGTVSGMGTIIEQVDYDDLPESVDGVSVDPADGSLWLFLYNETVMHVDREGARLQGDLSISSSSTKNIAVDPFDGTIWYAEWSDDMLIHMKRDGTNIAGDDFIVDLRYIAGIDIDPVDGTFWVCDRENEEAINVQRDGQTLNKIALNGDQPEGIAVDPLNGSLWQTSKYNVWNITKEGIVLKYFNLNDWVKTVAVDPGDGSLWVDAGGYLGHMNVYESALIVELPNYGGKFIAGRRGGL